MTDTPQTPADVAAAFGTAWSNWLKASTAAMTAPGAPAAPFDQLTAAVTGYAGAVAAPMRDLAVQQRELAESMQEWARLQRALADQVQTWAENQRKLADTLDLMVAPLAAFTPPRT